MFLLRWYKEWIEIRATLTENEKCDSCETLKAQLEIANYEKKQLLDRLLTKPEEPVQPARNETPMLVPRSVPWNMRRQMLEREDREKARLERNAPKPDSEVVKEETAKFEQELKDATDRREKQSS
jgi:hypothetical protein